MYRQDALFHEGIRPNAREQFVLGEQSSPLLNQHHQQIMGFRWQVDRHLAAGEPALGNVKRELPELVDLSSAHAV